jgi:hypothetical protein
MYIKYCASILIDGQVAQTERTSEVTETSPEEGNRRPDEAGTGDKKGKNGHPPPRTKLQARGVRKHAQTSAGRDINKRGNQT